MTRNIMTTVRDLRNWVDAATTNWDGRTDADIEKIVDHIRSQDHCPAWGRDWTEYLASFDDLQVIL